MKYVKINESIYKVIIPYKDIFTTVYVIMTDEGGGESEEIRRIYRRGEQ